MTNMGNKPEKATFAAGCFWCIEAVFQRLKGVKSVASGYTGGSVHNPTYDEVCNGSTGHTQAIHIEFDPDEISYGKLLEMFWKMHDPTTVNRQGTDVGTQYRSTIFYYNDEQKRLAEKSKFLVQQQLGKLVVTEIKPAKDFYNAEEHQQNYYNNNKSARYCQVVIAPKLKKLKLE